VTNPQGLYCGAQVLHCGQQGAALEVAKCSVAPRSCVVAPLGCIVTPRGCIVAPRGHIVAIRGCIEACRRCAVAPRGCIVATQGCIEAHRGSIGAHRRYNSPSPSTLILLICDVLPVVGTSQTLDPAIHIYIYIYMCVSKTMYQRMLTSQPTNPATQQPNPANPASLPQEGKGGGGWTVSYYASKWQNLWGRI